MPPPADLLCRFGFLVFEVARLNGLRFDRAARERLGLSRAQCRLLGVLAFHADAGQHEVSQAELAEELEMTPMGVAKLVERTEAGGWVARRTSAQDRRVNLVSLQPSAQPVLKQALTIGDELQAEVLADLTPDQQSQLVALLQKVHAKLASPRPG